MIERSADELEMAGQLEELERERGRAVVRDALRPVKHPDFNGSDCVDCGDKLPPVRLAYKWVRCAPCQSEIERRLKLQGRRA